MDEIRTRPPQRQTSGEMCRFTAWLSERERQALDEMAAELNTSVNFIVRVAIRQYLGFTKSA